MWKGRLAGMESRPGPGFEIFVRVYGICGPPQLWAPYQMRSGAMQIGPCSGRCQASGHRTPACLERPLSSSQLTPDVQLSMSHAGRPCWTAADCQRTGVRRCTAPVLQLLNILSFQLSFRPGLHLLPCTSNKTALVPRNVQRLLRTATCSARPLCASFRNPTSKFTCRYCRCQHR